MLGIRMGVIQLKLNMLRSSNGQDNGFSSRQPGFDSLPEYYGM